MPFLNGKLLSSFSLTSGIFSRSWHTTRFRPLTSPRKNSSVKLTLSILLGDQVLFIECLDLLIRRDQTRSRHEALDTSAGIPVVIARMAHFTVMVMSHTFTLGKIPDTLFTDAVC